ncbi:proteasome activator complex subunit 4 [Tribolium castaneum]|uniref:Proteasome activator complex subunit 4-like Protein n=2 Tax=Tribolium castaneum TaxID=7070 RepID=A0A139WFR8_TRICA|nr:PREDICTED: proteasome activator complex subunit 4 [Tribolium castaneum]KYB26764.1 Proteasome activator complex subunit 4-like Protein [Tribolium castaneum]|eukprot:XP_008193783.1 PREDICTED: proteasome activator complex subunit 4 [Tribolium castaneum]
MDENVSKRRYEKLGFKPQKENVYNKLLPYAEKLDEESTQLYADIKTNLIKSVLAREMRPGCALWTSRLNKYIKIYGMKFSKEDHICFIKLFYDLLTIPDLEPTRINKCASTLTQLLKKKYLISRDELQLEWRPLYDLCIRVMEKSKTDIGMYRCFSTLEGTLMNVIRLARIYFPASATQEILDEFRPRLCPMSSPTILSAIQYLEIFLPVCVKPEEAAISYDLWFEELMTLWNACHNASAWEDHMMWMIARLSSYTMGYINWEPYIPMMFVRFSRSFQLPVAYRQKQTGKQYKIEISAMAIWITCALNGDKNSTFFHLEKFMQALESYYYPANMGRWSMKLRELLRKLAYYFVQRVHCERYKKKTWDTNIPDHYKLTDEDIDRFVNIMKPCLEQAMFSRQGGQDIILALQYLGSLRPNLVIPMTLDKLYASMDSLTEPHKLTSSMMGVTAVARYMVQGARSNYPEGFTHVLPLLMALLPGIDPNDIRKCLVTFNFMVHFINMIPLINCSEASKYHDDLTEEEHIVCEASDGFEDFVLQFFDRLCLWVESNSLDFVRLEQDANSNNNKNRAEVIAETALFSIISTVLHQCSPEIFTAALKKVFNFVSDKVMEIQISGKMTAIICQGFAKVNPKETLKLFIPHLCDIIEGLMNENPNIEKEEHLDAELLYNLQILSEVVDARTELVTYSDRLMKILDRTLHMSSLSGSQMASRMLEVMMTSLTYILPTEYRSCSTPYDTHVKDFLSIREWGKAQNIKDLEISWYVPGDKEIALVQSLINKYLVPEVSKLSKHASGESVLTREELRRSLRIVISILSSHPVLPIWDEPAIQLVDSVLDPWAFNLIVSDSHAVNMPDGSNIRKVIADLMHKVQKKILEVDEGDTKSIHNIVHIYNILLFNKSRVHDFEYQWKNFHLVKKLLEDRLHQNKLHLRHILINRVMLQQEFRIESRSCSFTETHKQILLDLFELSVSRYSEVRISAQSKLFSVVSYFPYSYTVLTSRIFEILKLNSEEHHEKFKGCLYILISPKNTPIVARHDWNFIRQLWPLIIKSMPSEKPSIVNLINAIVDAVNRFFPTIAINLVFPQRCLDDATLLSQNVPKCDLTHFQKYMDEGEKTLQIKCQKRAVAYNETVDGLLDACINGNLHWRYHSMAVTFLKVLVHYDVKYNVRIVKYFLQALINESITIRKTALRVSLFILIQNKPKFTKIEIDPYGFSNSKRNNHKLRPGIREDNKWLLYDSKTVPKDSEAWEKPRFLHDHSIGYYAWPTKVEIYAPPSEQPHIDKRFPKLSEEEKEIYEFFSNAENLDQFIKYFSMEEKKGKDQFNAYKFLLFKNLFKLFEDKLLDPIIPHLEKLVADKNESSQRCAAEIISGLIRGSKHWSFDKITKLWSVLIPILETAVVNMCSETMTDWGLSMAMALDSRDPNRYHWILEYLVKDPLSDQTSFVACGRLHMLHAALNQQTWRNNELSVRLFDYFKQHLSHPFQNIRDKISSCLTMIFSKDLIFPDDANDTNSAGIKAFFKEIMPTLDNLYSYTLSKIESKDNPMDTSEVSKDMQGLSLENDEVRENAMRLFKLVSKYVTSSVVRMNYSTLPEYFEILPLSCVLQSNDTDDEIAPICSSLLAVLAYTITIDKYMPSALEAIRKVATCPFWSARAVITEFMSGFVFHNMPTIISKKEWVLDIQHMVLELLEDVQPEVRVSASQVLSGLLHCQFIPNPQELLAQFKQKAKTKLKKKNLNNSNSLNLSTLRFRHAGVLGLCAFINSHPYDVPDFLPDVFGQLGPHLNDPQPIPATIRKTLGDFKRTHHENWEIHKLKFTEEELLVLSDLTVPPSYYA